MPRPKKIPSYEEEIQKIETQIAKSKADIRKLEEEKSNLLRQKRERDLGALYDAIQASGRSIDDILSSLQS